MVAAGYFIRETKPGAKQKGSELASIEPGKSKAILRLVDNRVIEITREQETRFDVAEGIAATNNSLGNGLPGAGGNGKDGI